MPFALALHAVALTGCSLVLETNPQTGRFVEVGQDEVGNLFKTLRVFRYNKLQLVLTHLEQVVPEEQSPDWVLDTLAKLGQIAENLRTRSFPRLDVGHTHSYQQVKSRKDVPRVLNRLVQLCQFPTMSRFVSKERREMLELLENQHVKLIVESRG